VAEKKINLQGIVTPSIVSFFETRSGLIVDTESQKKLYTTFATANIPTVFQGSNAGESRQMDFGNLSRSVAIGGIYLSENYPEIGIVTGLIRKNINDVINLAKIAQDTGTDALVITPGYSDTTANNLVNKVIENTTLPLIVYNNPEFQDKNNLPLELIKEWSKNNRFIGIKDSSRDPAYFNELLKLRSENFKVFQGDTKAGLNPQIKNCDGMVAIEANVYPEALVARWQKNLIGPLQEVMNDFLENKKAFGGSIGYCKEILFRRGIIQNPVLYNQ
jgi:4-hydroxy-tetrahydrodipicolinate synthase